jgi:diaminopimelate decarboxylase
MTAQFHQDLIRPTHPPLVHDDWWVRERLLYRGNRLNFCGRDVASLATAFSEPLFLYDARRAVENVDRVLGALKATGFKHRLYYAMKANRFRPLLCELRNSRLHGVDACSPEEVREALACGYAPERISYTAHGMMPDEATLLGAFPGIRVNCDTLASLDLLGSVSPGRSIGIRVNPGVGIGYGDRDRLSYAGAKTTKFGIYAEQFEEALERARRHGLRVKWLHCHAGCGYLDPQLPSFRRVLAALCSFVQRVPELEGVNLGGGLGLPHRAADRQLDLETWGHAIQSGFAGRDLEIAVKPGDFVAKDAGMLVLRVGYVELKRDRLFAGLNGGFNLAIEPVVYDLPCEPVPCVRRDGPQQQVTLAGNINEAMDLWASDIAMPPLESGDFVALLNAGGYASSMSSNHCMRGQFRELLLQ